MDTPADVIDDLNVRRQSCSVAVLANDFHVADRRFGELYLHLLDVQTKYETRIHKGWELYNHGRAILFLRFDEAVKKFHLAYIEDLIEGDPANEDQAEQEQAFLAIHEATDERLLREIKSIVIEYHSRDQLPMFPEMVYDEALKRVYGKVQSPVLKIVRPPGPAPNSRPLEDIVLPYHRRCFVGGNYYSGGVFLEDIRSIVSELGYEPIVARDFAMAEKDIHHRSLLLLHMSASAIFEVTVPAGQLMELERCRDFDIEPLIVRNTTSYQDPSVSAMISTMSGVQIKGYRTLAELRGLIEAYLFTRDWQ